MPIIGLVHSSFVVFPVPRNLNYMWTFGAILMIMLVVQIVTGIVLAMHYTANAELAFSSVEHIMRNVGIWLVDALPACQRRLVLLHRRLHPHVSAACITARTRRRARSSGSSA